MGRLPGEDTAAPFLIRFQALCLPADMPMVKLSDMAARRIPPLRPVGQITRGKTARNRLRRVDNFVLMYAPEVLRLGGARTLYVDLGYGAEAYTTLESAGRLRRANPNLPVLGVEIDPQRVENALPFCDERTFFRLGGFNLPLEAGETVCLIRAFNVLRQYEEEQVADAHRLMGSYLLPGGLLIEGTSDPFGRIWTANILRRKAETVEMEALVFGTNFRWGFEPAIFQPVLPKNHIHRMVEGEPICEFMEAWKRAARLTIAARNLGLRQWFTASAEALAQSGFRIDLRKKFLRRGYLIWKGGQHE